MCWWPGYPHVMRELPAEDNSKRGLPVRFILTGLLAGFIVNCRVKMEDGLKQQLLKDRLDELSKC